MTVLLDLCLNPPKSYPCSTRVSRDWLPAHSKRLAENINVASERLRMPNSVPTAFPQDAACTVRRGVDLVKSEILRSAFDCFDQGGADAPAPVRLPDQKGREPRATAPRHCRPNLPSARRCPEPRRRDPERPGKWAAHLSFCMRGGRPSHLPARQVRSKASIPRRTTPPAPARPAEHRRDGRSSSSHAALLDRRQWSRLQETDLRAFNHQAGKFPVIDRARVDVDPGSAARPVGPPACGREPPPRRGRARRRGTGGGST